MRISLIGYQIDGILSQNQYWQLSEDDLASALAAEMPLDAIWQKFNVTVNTGRNKFARLMAREKGLESFFVSDSGPRYPKVRKNGNLVIGNQRCEVAKFKVGNRIRIDEAEPGRIVLTLTQ